MTSRLKLSRPPVFFFFSRVVVVLICSFSGFLSNVFFFSVSSFVVSVVHGSFFLSLAGRSHTGRCCMDVIKPR